MNEKQEDDRLVIIKFAELLMREIHKYCDLWKFEIEGFMAHITCEISCVKFTYTVKQENDNLDIWRDSVLISMPNAKNLAEIFMKEYLFGLELIRSKYYAGAKDWDEYLYQYASTTAIIESSVRKAVEKTDVLLGFNGESYKDFAMKD